MPATETQLEQRRSRLGSSDIAAILGVDTHKNAYDVWLDKTGKLIPEPESENDPRYAGKLIEPASSWAFIWRRSLSATLSRRF